MGAGGGAVAVLLLLWSATASAAPPDERERLASERRAVDARYAEARAACQAQFLVNDCQEAARTQRRLSLEGLRQQQLLLDDARRRERAAERAKQLDRTQAPSAPVAAPVLRQPRQATAAEPGLVSSVAPQGSVDVLPAAAAASRPAAATTSALQHQQAFDQRQQAARAHQQAVEARNARRDAVHPPAASLPLPGAKAASAASR